MLDHSNYVLQKTMVVITYTFDNPTQSPLAKEVIGIAYGGYISDLIVFWLRSSS